MHSTWERRSERKHQSSIQNNSTQSIHSVCSMNTFIQVLYGLTEVLTKVLTILQCSFMSPYTNSQIYSLRNIFPMASRFPHQSDLSYAPVCIPVYAPDLTDRSQPIRFSACSADPADVELVSQHFRMWASYITTTCIFVIFYKSLRIYLCEFEWQHGCVWNQLYRSFVS